MATILENNNLGWSFRRLEFPSGPYVVGVGLIGGIGLGTSWIHLLHLVSRTDPLYTSLMGEIIPLSISATLVATGLWIHSSSFEHAVFRIGTWCFVGSVVLVAVSVVSISYQHMNGITMADPGLVLTNHATVGGVLGVWMGIYDGQRWRRKRELDASRERSRELNDRLTVLNRVLRHDIRNAVNVISGNAALLREGTAEREQVAETIYSRAQELEGISSRARQIEQVLEADASAVDTVDLGPMLRAKALKLENTYPEIDVEVDVPKSVEVRTHTLIETAIDELLDNAVEHNNADTPRVTIDTVVRSTGVRTDDGEPGVVVRIHDNGPGIPKDEIEALDRGRETDLTHTSGLGLWLVRWRLLSPMEMSRSKLPNHEEVS